MRDSASVLSLNDDITEPTERTRMKIAGYDAQSPEQKCAHFSKERRRVAASDASDREPRCKAREWQDEAGGATREEKVRVAAGRKTAL